MCALGVTAYLALTTSCSSQPNKEEIVQRFTDTYSTLEEVKYLNYAQRDRLLREFDDITVKLYSETNPGKREELEFQKNKLKAELGFNGLVEFIIEGESFNSQLGKSITGL